MGRDGKGEKEREREEKEKERKEMGTLYFTLSPFRFWGAMFPGNKSDNRHRTVVIVCQTVV